MDSPASVDMASAPRMPRELIPADSPLAPFIWMNPGRMSGAPCFRNTRVPVQTLFNYLSGGDSLEDFLRGFPNVDRNQAVAVIGLASRGLPQGLARN